MHPWTTGLFDQSYDWDQQYVPRPLGALVRDALLAAPAVAPTILAGPQSQAALLGTSVAFAVSASGSFPRTCQWRKDGVPLSGQTNLVCSFTASTLSDEGAYTVVVSNRAGSVTSAPAPLILHGGALPESPNLFSNPGFEAGSPAGWFALGNTLAVTNAPVHSGTFAGYACDRHHDYEVAARDLVNLISVPGTYDVSFWVRLASGAPTNVQLNLHQNDGAGPVWSALSSEICTSTEWTELKGRLHFQPTGTVTTMYLYLICRDLSIDLLADDASLRFVVPPNVVTRCTNQTVAVGDDAVLSVITSGTEPLSLQWFFNGISLAAETNDTLALRRVTTNQSGTYSLLATNSAGAVAVTVAVLAVVAPTPTLTVALAGNHLPLLTVTGRSGFTCGLEVSTNLLDWAPFLVFPNLTGTLQTIDPTAPNYQRRFYRAFLR